MTYSTSYWRASRVRAQRVKLASLNGVAILTTIVTLSVAGAFAITDGSVVQGVLLWAGVAAILAFFRVSTKDDIYRDYLAATDVLAEMASLITDMEKENIPIEGRHGEAFYKHFTLAQEKATGSHLSTRDMENVVFNTRLAHVALEDHAAVESVEED